MVCVDGDEAWYLQCRSKPDAETIDGGVTFPRTQALLVQPAPHGSTKQSRAKSRPDMFSKLVRHMNICTHKFMLRLLGGGV